MDCIREREDQADPGHRGELVVAVLDDCPTDLEVVKRLLGRLDRWQVRVLEYLDPAEAIQSLGEQQVDLILTDYHMGLWTGFDVLDRLRGAGQNAPVVLLTGSDPASLPRSPVEAGAVSCLQKFGLNGDRLTECLEALLH